MKLITLHSGGLDSTVLVFYLLSQGNKVDLLTFDYGQRHKKETESAHQIAQSLNVRWDLIDLTSVGKLLEGSALTDSQVQVPSGEYTLENLAVTVVPNRNAIMASVAAGIAVSRNFDGIAIAMHAGDHAVYPDCTPKFVLALEYLLSIATGREQRRLVVNAPFLYNTKSQIVSSGANLGVPFEKTWSCYKGGELHCGVCSTCQERKKAFVEAGVSDPTKYEV
jgi:7-cyano-7-deazaguanine synthase